MSDIHILDFKTLNCIIKKIKDIYILSELFPENDNFKPALCTSTSFYLEEENLSNYYVFKKLSSDGVFVKDTYYVLCLYDIVDKEIVFIKKKYEVDEKI